MDMLTSAYIWSDIRNAKKDFPPETNIGRLFYLITGALGSFTRMLSDKGMGRLGQCTGGPSWTAMGLTSAWCVELRTTPCNESSSKSK